MENYYNFPALRRRMILVGTRQLETRSQESRTLYIHVLIFRLTATVWAVGVRV